jgi:hypothetical protein
MASRKKNKKRNKRKKRALPRPAAKKKLASKMAPTRRKSSPRKSAKKKSKPRGRPALVDLVSFEPRGMGARSGGQAGDVQGLSGLEGAASESVEELLEEGNAYEAEVVKGVEDAESTDEMEVETHEVPEDDVPEEYRDQH